MLEIPVDRARLAGRLRVAVTRMNRRLRQEAGTGMSATAESALATISRHATLSLGELAAYEGVKPPSITATVAALEAAGLVSRTADAADRRVSRVVATPKGKLRLQRGRTRKTAFLTARLEGLTEHELRVLDEAADLLEGLLDEAEGGRR